MAICWFVKCLFDKTVPMLVCQMVVSHRACRTGIWASTTGTTHTILATLRSHYMWSIPPFLNFDFSEGASKCSPLKVFQLFSETLQWCCIHTGPHLAFFYHTAVQVTDIVGELCFPDKYDVNSVTESTTTFLLLHFFQHFWITKEVEGKRYLTWCYSYWRGAV